MGEIDNEIVQKMEEIQEHQRQIEKLRLEIMVLIKDSDKLNMDYIQYNT